MYSEVKREHFLVILITLQFHSFLKKERENGLEGWVGVGGGGWNFTSDIHVGESYCS